MTPQEIRAAVARADLALEPLRRHAASLPDGPRAQWERALRNARGELERVAAAAGAHPGAAVLLRDQPSGPDVVVPLGKVA